MAGGIKVALWSAVGPGTRCWGPGSGGAAWLLLVVAGCVVCGSGTSGAAADQGPGARALNLEKVGSSGGCGPLLRAAQGAEGDAPGASDRPN